ncbi:hypothetical protein HCU64_14755 [Methylobacterium sp. C25]|uniref:hypothetical protein n=1 Tax=Methylobacterium sp. C25 TaxID=2721622 RepID=UPI001F2F5733|nr:hypothetical protein [Methylobacterium sp. C25]MCE4225018.1 hypothetical protein [Methylobacterium sp. C25]
MVWHAAAIGWLRIGDELDRSVANKKRPTVDAATGVPSLNQRAPKGHVLRPLGQTGNGFCRFMKPKPDFMRQSAVIVGFTHRILEEG